MIFRNVRMINWAAYTLAFQQSDFRWLWAGGLGGNSAYWGLLVVRAVLVLQMTGSSTMVGITTFAAMAPRFVTPPIAGYLADRFTRRTVLVSGYLAQMVHSFVLAGLAIAGVLDAWHVVGLAAFNGAVRSFQMTATQSLVPNVVPKEHLLNAVALNMVSTHGSKFVGPGLVAIPLVLSGPTAAFVACSAFYIAGLVGILRIRTRTSGGLSKGTSFAAGQKEAVKYILGSKPLVALFLLVMMHCSMTMAYESVLPSFARDVIKDPVGGVSYLMMGVGAGSVILALLVAGMKGQRTRGWIFLVTGLASGISLVLLAVSVNPAMAVIAAGTMGGSQVGFMAIANSSIQTIAPDELRGRITGLNQINIGGTMAILNLGNGMFADTFGASTVLLIWGTVFTLIITGSLKFQAVRALCFAKGK